MPSRVCFGALQIFSLIRLNSNRYKNSPSIDSSTFTVLIPHNQNTSRSTYRRQISLVSKSSFPFTFIKILSIFLTRTKWGNNLLISYCLGRGIASFLSIDIHDKRPLYPRRGDLTSLNP